MRAIARGEASLVIIQPSEAAAEEAAAVVREHTHEKDVLQAEGTAAAAAAATGSTATAAISVRCLSAACCRLAALLCAHFREESLIVRPLNARRETLRRHVELF